MSNKLTFYYRGVFYDSLEEMEKASNTFNYSTFSDHSLEELGKELIDSIKVNFRARNISITNEQLKMIFEQSLNDIVRMAESHSEEKKDE